MWAEQSVTTAKPRLPRKGEGARHSTGSEDRKGLLALLTQRLDRARRD
jgi:hypothetical protein